MPKKKSSAKSRALQSAPEITPQPTPAATVAPTPTPISATIKHELMFNGTEGNKAVQNYLPLSNGIYTMQRNGNDVVLRKGKLEEKGYSSFVKKTDMTGFAHGDTFEQFFVKGKEYYLIAGNAYKEFGRNLLIISKKNFDKNINKKEFKFEKNSKMYLQMSKLEYANKSGRNNGKSVTRVAGALTADGSTLVMWKQLTEKKGKRMELSLYDMKKIRKIIGGGWRICITSGDEKINSPLTITRMDVRRKGKGIQYNAFREFVSLPALLGQNNSGIPKFELEGCHVVGNNLDFGVVAKNESEVKQYIAYVPLNSIQRTLIEK